MVALSFSNRRPRSGDGMVFESPRAQKRHHNVDALICIETEDSWIALVKHRIGNPGLPIR